MTHEPKPLAPVNPKGLDDIAQSLLEETIAEPRNTLVLPSTFKKDRYLLIPNTNEFIAREETHKNITWENAHYALQEDGLYMPSPKTFMLHFLNVITAHEGKSALYTADNKKIPRDEVEDLYKYFTSGHRNGCWTWLDSYFKEMSGRLEILTNHRVIQTGTQKTLEARSQQPLEPCLKEDCYVNLVFNQQGLPTKKARNQVYQQGKNIYFYHPKENAVAWFRADAGRADLNCDGDPRFSIAGLGVFACAEGAKIS